MKRTKYVYLETAEPSEGQYRKDMVIFNSNPTPGANVGWVCIVEGTANQNPWSAQTAYTVGQRVNANGNVYECTGSGISGTRAPAHKSGTAIDGTVTWSFVDRLAVFRTWGVIS